MNKSGCLLCGEELVYTKSEVVACALCGKKEATEATCKKGHYICNACHEKDALSIIKEKCMETTSKNPIEIAQEIMDHVFIHMHGPEHHILIGSALLSAYKNAGGDINLEEALETMRKRGEACPGGSCGFWGACGAAISSGIFFSIITGTTPLSTDFWAKGNELTSRNLAAMAKLGGPRCCKRNGFVSMTETVHFVEEELGIKMELPEQIICHYYPHNSQCLGKRCPYFPK